MRSVRSRFPRPTKSVHTSANLSPAQLQEVGQSIKDLQDKQIAAGLAMLGLKQVKTGAVADIKASLAAKIAGSVTMTPHQHEVFATTVQKLGGMTFFISKKGR